MSKGTILLEYNEKQKCFHNNFCDKTGKFDHPLFSNNWKPICIIPEKFVTSRFDDGYDDLIQECMKNSYPFETVYSKIISFMAQHV